MCRKYGRAYEDVVTQEYHPLATPSPKDIAEAIAAVFSVVSDIDNKPKVRSPAQARPFVRLVCNIYSKHELKGVKGNSMRSA